MEYKIKAYLKEHDLGCDYSGHFMKEWVEEADTLHPLASEIEVDINWIKDGEPSVHLFKEDVQLIIMVGAQINPATLQEEIINLRSND